MSDPVAERVTPHTAIRSATDEQLAQWSIPVNGGCNPIHELASLELRRRGYVFIPSDARWVIYGERYIQCEVPANTCPKCGANLFPHGCENCREDANPR